MDTANGKGSIGVHFFYVTLILMLVIIGLITHKWTGIQEFREYLNVGATVTSLVLAVLAIIYSFVSNGQQQGVLGAVESAATTASMSVAKIDRLMSTAENLQVDAVARSNDLKKLSDSLTLAVEGIRQETSSMIYTNTDLAHKVNSLPSQLGEIRGLIESSSRAAAPAFDNQPSSLEAMWDESMVVAELKRASLHGLAIICSFIKARELNKCVSFSKFGKFVDDEKGGYAWGYAVGFSGTGLIDIDQNEVNPSVYELTSVNDFIVIHAQGEFESRVALQANNAEKELFAKFDAAIVGALVNKPNAPKSLPEE